MSDPFEPSIVIVETNNNTNVATIGTQGPPGPPGPQGSGSGITATAGQDIAAFTVVVLLSGLLYPADPTNATHAPLVAGITTADVANGDTAAVVCSGEVAGMSGLNTVRYYAGLSGSLSVSVAAPGAAWIKSLGQGKSATELILLPGPSVLL